MAASSNLVSFLQQELKEARASICSIVSASTSSATAVTHAAVALQRNRDIHSLLQRLLSLHSQLTSIVRTSVMSDGVARPHDVLI